MDKYVVGGSDKPDGWEYQLGYGPVDLGVAVDSGI
jgi:hypothetical protein